MKKIVLVLVIGCWVLGAGLKAQTVSEKLQTAYRQFESDSQLRHAISSLYVINAKTGEVVFGKNSQIGLAPASTQKIITATTAFELLGRDYKYRTELGHDGEIKNGVLNGNLYVIGSGDPTLGSWRYSSAKEEKILSDMGDAVLKKGINKINGDILVKAQGRHSQSIPDGWIWQDIGNYYGAGSFGLNWRENQYDLILQSGDKLDDPVVIKKTIPELYKMRFISEVRSAAKSTGDNAYIYLPLRSSGEYITGITPGYVRGTIPIGENAFTISGAMTNPDEQLSASLRKNLAEKISVRDFNPYGNIPPFKEEPLSGVKEFYVHYSPSLDSIIYWFLKRSINLYGEALIKTMAYEKKSFGATDTGVSIIRDFWEQKGLDPEELNIKDGSGLSPQNRITTHAQVEILKYAKKQSWFPYFFDALPEFNHMKMKSGTISDAKGFCGYHTSGDGTQYIFSFLVNNYSGSSPLVVQKMYKVLDVLK